MAIVPLHEEIKNKQDVKYLVSCIIDRLVDNKIPRWRIAEMMGMLFNATKEFLQGSSIEMTDDEIRDIIVNSVDILYRNGFINIEEGENHVVITGNA